MTSSQPQTQEEGTVVKTEKTLLKLSSTRIMAVKDLFRELQPLPLYAMLVLTLMFFTVELVVSHVTHALTLLVDSYHTLCNLIALVGCLITVKYGSGSSMQNISESLRTSVLGEEELVSSTDHEQPGCMSACHSSHHHQQGSSRERRLRNTFGWARIEVLLMLVGTVFLASLCFSLVVEAVQTLCHIGHQDEMHHPIQVLIVGCSGLLLNGLCYLLIGGYTFHQGSLLHVTASGDVVLDRSLTHDTMRQGGRRLSTRRQAAANDPEVCVSGKTDPSIAHVNAQTMRQGPREMLRDVIGCVFVIICSISVYFTEQNVAKYIDPILSIVSAVLLLALSIPYMRESGRILLQTIPDCIDIESLKSELIRAFPSLVNVHDIHIWCLTQTRIFATAHLVLRSHEDYVHIKEALVQFFHERGITQATIQPEFYKPSEDGEPEPECYLQCRGEGCLQRHCCQNSVSSSTEDLHTVSCFGTSHGHSHGHSHDKKSHKKHNHKHGHSHEHGHNHEHGHCHSKDKQETGKSTTESTSSKPPLKYIQEAPADNKYLKTEALNKAKPIIKVIGRQRSFSESYNPVPVSGSSCADSDSLEECDIIRVRQQSMGEGLDHLQHGKELSTQ